MTLQPNVEDDYSGTEKTYILNPFTVTPAICSDRVTYSCESVTGPASADFSALCDDFGNPTANQLGLVATSAQYLDSSLPPGIYTFTIRATSPNGVQTTDDSFTWTLTSPCAPPESVTLEGIDDILCPDGTCSVFVPYPTVITILPAFCPISSTKATSVEVADA